ncbi:MAG: DUF2284 domain-containing protein [Cetobacterium sp.]
MNLDKKLEEFIKNLDNDIKMIKIDKKDIVFQNKVKMSCFYCSKYNTRWTCPPRIPAFDYEKLVEEFDNVVIVYVDMKFTPETYEHVRHTSSFVLHKAILKIEEFLLENNESLFNTFVGGSCKLCKNGCADDKCRNPGKARIPMEALGINVVETMKKYGIEIKFPVTDSLMRLGLVLY